MFLLFIFIFLTSQFLSSSWITGTIIRRGNDKWFRWHLFPINVARHILLFIIIVNIIMFFLGRSILCTPCTQIIVVEANDFWSFKATSTTYDSRFPTFYGFVVWVEHCCIHIIDIWFKRFRISSIHIKSALFKVTPTNKAAFSAY